MKNFHDPLADEQGFILVAALLVLLIVVVLGIASMDNSSIELQISGNEKVHNQTFYAAESGAEMGVEIMEQNLFCPDGFTVTSTEDGTDVADLENYIRVFERNSNKLVLYQNTPHPISDICDMSKFDIALPLNNLSGGEQVSYIYVGGETQMAFGGSLQMAAGYEGKGKSAAGGGVNKVYDIYSQHNGIVNSQSIVGVGWRYPVGWTGSCNY